ncbi:hypothetical protein [Halotalea alkalilenta]|uniref:hypothetical protein n=1 Tax=Halotalea alkalilenta TaxID=376489 RepID=UPI0004872C12|nr:hypothetical protein [Halotalea alkalilenta]
MTVLVEGQLHFDFPDDWEASKLDDWHSYRRCFATLDNGIKCVDFLAYGPGRDVWLIEVKDYRQGRITSMSELIEAVVGKVRDSLGVVSSACWQHQAPEEQRLARLATQKGRLNIVLHIEQPRHRSRLRPEPLDRASLKQSLRRKLHKLSASQWVVDSRSSGDLPWAVN